MGRYLRVSEEAEAELLEIVRQRAHFDLPSALALPREIFEKARALSDGLVQHQIVLVHEGITYRYFVVKSVTVLYFEHDEYVEMTRIHGAGRDWRHDL